MTNTLIFIWGAIAILGISSITVLVWAVSTGQLSKFQQGSASIFDDEEPMGQVTDSFPSGCEQKENSNT